MWVFEIVGMLEIIEFPNSEKFCTTSQNKSCRHSTFIKLLFVLCRISIILFSFLSTKTCPAQPIFQHTTSFLAKNVLNYKRHYVVLACRKFLFSILKFCLIPRSLLRNLESRQVCKADIRILKSSMQEKTSKKFQHYQFQNAKKKVFHFVFRIGFGLLRQWLRSDAVSNECSWLFMA